MWDLFKRIINLQSFFLRRLYHQICALRSTANSQDCITFIQ